MTDAEKIAERIARDLFVNGFGETANRLVLTVDTDPPRTLGGWNFDAVFNRILAVLLSRAEIR